MIEARTDSYVSLVKNLDSDVAMQMNKRQKQNNYVFEKPWAQEIFFVKIIMAIIQLDKDYSTVNRFPNRFLEKTEHQNY